MCTCTSINNNSFFIHLSVLPSIYLFISGVFRISIVDLAGSERSKKTGATGDRCKEAGSINTSLHVLGRCIEGMRHNQKATKYVHVHVCMHVYVLILYMCACMYTCTCVCTCMYTCTCVCIYVHVCTCTCMY